MLLVRFKLSQYLSLGKEVKKELIKSTRLTCSINYTTMGKDCLSQQASSVGVACGI